jgi:hypothetical protein
MIFKVDSTVDSRFYTRTDAVVGIARAIDVFP